MEQDKRTGKKIKAEEDRILRISITVVVILFVVAAIFVGVRLLNPRVDVTAGREKLEELTSVDVESVEEAILVVDRSADDEEDSEETESEEDTADETAQEDAEE